MELKKEEEMEPMPSDETNNEEVEEPAEADPAADDDSHENGGGNYKPMLNVMLNFASMLSII